MTPIIAIICTTIICMYAIHKIVDYGNPYTDEIHSETPIGSVYGDDIITGRRMVYKRTWKNGKVKYISKIINNNWI
jgi:hypothetical protein